MRSARAAVALGLLAIAAALLACGDDKLVAR